MRFRRIVLPLVASVVLLTATSCGGGSAPAPEAKKEESAAPKAAETAAPAGPSGDSSIAGKVMFAGVKPVMKPVSMDATPSCQRQHAKAPVSEEVVINADGSLRNVFVYVKAGLPAGASWPAPKQAVLIDQAGCVYKPHVAAAIVGQDVQFTNSDETGHNVHPLPRVNREWNQSQAPKGEAIIRSFDKEEIGLPIKCNLHPWMRVYLNVVAHPFHAVTGEDGSFTLKGLPAGEYTVEAWHERFGVQEIKVKLGAGEAGKAAFTFKAS